MLLETRNAEYSILELAIPGRPAVNFGLLLSDPATDELHLRLRDDIAELAAEEDAEPLALLQEDLAAKARELGAKQLLDQLEDSLSNVLRITDRRRVMVRELPIALQRLYEQHVLGARLHAVAVRPFVTHLPLYSLRAAAGRFGEDMETEPTDWVLAPSALRLTPDMFIAHVTGHSMEPAIADGSLAVFRHNPAGSRQGKRVLVWRRGASESGGEFTVKVYESVKKMTQDGWQHARIRLKPLNPDYDVLELDEDSEYRVLGEYICTIAEEAL